MADHPLPPPPLPSSPPLPCPLPAAPAPPAAPAAPCCALLRPAAPCCPLLAAAPCLLPPLPPCPPLPPAPCPLPPPCPLPRSHERWQKMRLIRNEHVNQVVEDWPHITCQGSPNRCHPYLDTSTMLVRRVDRRRERWRRAGQPSLFVAPALQHGKEISQQASSLSQLSKRQQALSQSLNLPCTDLDAAKQMPCTQEMARVE